MRIFAMFACALMFAGCFTGLVHALDPLDGEDAGADHDRDGVPNAEEYTWATDPNDPDTDGGGAPDGWEVYFQTHRAVDKEGNEYITLEYSFDPLDPTDEGVVDGNLLVQVRDPNANVLVNDPDGDGWTNLHEYLVGTDPTTPNTDQDSYGEDSSDPDPLISNDDYYGDYPWGPNCGDESHYNCGGDPDYNPEATGCCGDQPDQGGNGGGGSGEGEGEAEEHA
jgi:hypothetical protein